MDAGRTVLRCTARPHLPTRSPKDKCMLLLPESNTECAVRRVHFPIQQNACASVLMSPGTTPNQCRCVPVCVYNGKCNTGQERALSKQIVFGATRLMPFHCAGQLRSSNTQALIANNPNPKHNRRIHTCMHIKALAFRHPTVGDNQGTTVRHAKMPGPQWGQSRRSRSLLRNNQG